MLDNGSEEMKEIIQGKRELDEGGLDKSVETFTQDINISNTSTVPFVNWVRAYIPLKRPFVAIQDAKKLSKSTLIWHQLSRF